MNDRFINRKMRKKTKNKKQKTKNKKQKTINKNTPFSYVAPAFSNN